MHASQIIKELEDLINIYGDRKVNIYTSEYIDEEGFLEINKPVSKILSPKENEEFTIVGGY